MSELRFTESIARLAGKHILRERASLEVSLKGTNDLVTNVDKSTEALIIEEIRKVYPDDMILGEESGTAECGEGGRRRWVIDPIDGTQNFAQGIPLYCVSIGLQVDGESVVGCIYDPNRDELFSAALGEGAFLNGEPMGVSKKEDLGEALVVTGFPLTRTDEFKWTVKQYFAMTDVSRGVRRLGSAALDLAYVACGRIDLFWEYGLKPWDTAAGYLMVQEAGGVVTDLEGGAFRAESPNVLATNGRLHRAGIQVLAAALE